MHELNSTSRIPAFEKLAELCLVPHVACVQVIADHFSCIERGEKGISVDCTPVT